MTKFSMAPEVAHRPLRPRGAVIFDLDYPPPAVDADACRAWKQRSNWNVLANRPPRAPGPVRMLLEIEEKSGRRILEQLSQPVIELCVERGIIDSDHRNTLREVRVRWANVRGVRVTIESAVQIERRA